MQINYNDNFYEMKHLTSKTQSKMSRFKFLQISRLGVL